MSIHVNGTTLLTGSGLPTTIGIGASEFGDRGAWDVVSYPTYHARDIYTGAYTYHLPAGPGPGGANDLAPVWDPDQEKYILQQVATSGSDGVGYHTHTEIDITDLLHNAIELQGISISSGSPGDGDFLRYSLMDNEWQPQSITTGSQGDRVFGISISGEVAVGEILDRVRVPWSGEIYNVVTSSGSGCAPVGDDLIIDIKKNGVSIFASQSTMPTIPNGELDDLDCVPDYVSFEEGDIFTFEVIQKGSVYGGGFVIVQIRAGVI